MTDEMRIRMLNSDNVEDIGKAYQNKNQIFEDDAWKLPVKGAKNDLKPYGEEAVVRQILGDIEEQINVSERNIKLPGLRRHFEMIVGFVANFKDTEMPNRSIKSFARSKDNDIAVGFGRDEVYGVDNWQQTGTSAGSQDILPASGTHSLNDEEWAFFTGDFVDLDSDSILTAIQYTSMDGESYNPEDILMSERGTDLQLSEVTAGVAKETVDIDAKSAFSGDLELVPVNVVATKGSNVPTLT